MICQFDCKFPWINSNSAFRQSMESSNPALSKETKNIEFQRFVGILHAILVRKVFLVILCLFFVVFLVLFFCCFSCFLTVHSGDQRKQGIKNSNNIHNTRHTLPSYTFIIYGQYEHAAWDLSFSSYQDVINQISCHMDHYCEWQNVCQKFHGKMSILIRICTKSCCNVKNTQKIHWKYCPYWLWSTASMQPPPEMLFICIKRCHCRS